MAENCNKSWAELFRWITPIAITVAIFILSGLRLDIANFKQDIQHQLASIDDKLFKHLTNDEVHAPRAQTVSKVEYDQHCKEEDKVINRVYLELTTMRQELQRLK